MDYNKAALEMHQAHSGKVGIVSKVEVHAKYFLKITMCKGTKFCETSVAGHKKIALCSGGDCQRKIRGEKSVAAGALA